MDKFGQEYLDKRGLKDSLPETDILAKNRCPIISADIYKHSKYRDLSNVCPFLADRNGHISGHKSIKISMSLQGHLLMSVGQDGHFIRQYYKVVYDFLSL